jgi:hypothetical protein
MKKTSILSFEVCNCCNLKNDHPMCPINEDHHPDKTRAMDDDTIVRTAGIAYTLGFAGYIAFHYYNEPLMASARCINLIKRIRGENPKAKFLLWTNGRLIPRDGGAIMLSHFDKIYVTNYDGADYSFLNTVCMDVTIATPNMDARRHDDELNDDGLFCLRPFNEIVIDYFGGMRLCCIDWRGHVRIGNVQVMPFTLLVKKFVAIREAVAHAPMSPEAPEFCRTCPCKHQSCLDWVSKWKTFSPPEKSPWLATAPPSWGRGAARKSTGTTP